MKYLLLTLFFWQTSPFLGQKSLSLIEAEEYLQKNNLLLLAEQYTITAAQAAVVQAKIWEQPYFSLEFNAYNPQDKKVLDAGNNGQKGLAIQQLIYLGGKKKNEVLFAQSNVTVAELQFEQLLRNLKFQLVQTFYSLYFDQQKVSSVDTQIAILDTLLTNYMLQSNKGNIPLKEVVRLQSLVLNLKNDRNNLIQEMIGTQQVLSLLTGISEPISPILPDLNLINTFQNKMVSKEEVMALTIANNLDYLTAVKVSESQEVLVRWQRSLAVPDLTAGAAYDQRGGAFNNQVNVTLGIPLPLWNKNKGSIRMAQAQLTQAQLNKDYKKLELQIQAESLWAMWIQQKNQLNSIDKIAIDNLEMVYNGMVANFQKRNITLLEFTDFMESYNQAIIQVNEINKAWILASISLNYITNKEIF